MKVIFGSFPALTLLGGGVETQMRSLAAELQKLGHQVELFDPWKRYDLREFDLFHLFGAHIGTYHLGRAVKNLGMRLAVSPVFYSRHQPARVAASLKLAMKLRRRGGFWTEHVICHELCAMADLLLPNTQAEAEMVERGLGVRGKPVVVVPNGVDERFAQATPDEFAARYGRDFILYVGHIGWGRKNLVPFLEVVEQMKRPTILIGPVIANDYGRRCLEIARRNDFITVIPGLPPDSTLLASAYAACAVFILPSLYETPGVAALEAGLAGARVCITENGGTTEYFGDEADYLDPGSRTSIARALERSLARPRSQVLNKRILAGFLWRHAAARLAEAYAREG